MRSQEVRRLPEAASAIQTQSSGIAALVPKQRAASFWESLFSGGFPFFWLGKEGQKTQSHEINISLNLLKGCCIDKLMEPMIEAHAFCSRRS